METDSAGSPPLLLTWRLLAGAPIGEADVECTGPSPPEGGLSVAVARHGDAAWLVWPGAADSPGKWTIGPDRVLAGPISAAAAALGDEATPRRRWASLLRGWWWCPAGAKRRLIAWSGEGPPKLDPRHAEPTPPALTPYRAMAWLALADACTQGGPGHNMHSVVQALRRLRGPQRSAWGLWVGSGTAWPPANGADVLFVLSLRAAGRAALPGVALDGCGAAWTEGPQHEHIPSRTAMAIAAPAMMEACERSDCLSADDADARLAIAAWLGLPAERVLRVSWQATGPDAEPVPSIGARLGPPGASSSSSASPPAQQPPGAPGQAQALLRANARARPLVRHCRWVISLPGAASCADGKAWFGRRGWGPSLAHGDGVVLCAGQALHWLSYACAATTCTAWLTWSFTRAHSPQRDPERWPGSGSLRPPAGSVSDGIWLLPDQREAVVQLQRAWHDAADVLGPATGTGSTGPWSGALTQRWARRAIPPMLPWLYPPFMDRRWAMAMSYHGGGRERLAAGEYPERAIAWPEPPDEFVVPPPPTPGAEAAPRGDVALARANVERAIVESVWSMPWRQAMADDAALSARAYAGGGGGGGGVEDNDEAAQWGAYARACCPAPAPTDQTPRLWHLAAGAAPGLPPCMTLAIGSAAHAPGVTIKHHTRLWISAALARLGHKPAWIAAALNQGTLVGKGGFAMSKRRGGAAAAIAPISCGTLVGRALDGDGALPLEASPGSAQPRGVCPLARRDWWRYPDQRAARAIAASALAGRSDLAVPYQGIMDTSTPVRGQARRDVEQVLDRAGQAFDTAGDAYGPVWRAKCACAAVRAHGNPALARPKCVGRPVDWPARRALETERESG